jgi:hypothetical protein
MDTEQLVAHGRARFEHESARRTLREKYQAKLTFAYGVAACGWLVQT